MHQCTSSGLCQDTQRLSIAVVSHSCLCAPHTAAYIRDISKQGENVTLGPNSSVEFSYQKQICSSIEQKKWQTKKLQDQPPHELHSLMIIKAQLSCREDLISDLISMQLLMYDHQDNWAPVLSLSVFQMQSEISSEVQRPTSQCRYSETASARGRFHATLC